MTPKFLGYVVHLPASDEFLALFRSEGDSFAYGWAKSQPGKAKLFPDIASATTVATGHSPDAVVCTLTDNGTHYLVRTPRAG